MEASIAENIALVWLDEYAGRGLGLVRRGADARGRRIGRHDGH